jgi:hypothetical protein
MRVNRLARELLTLDYMLRTIGIGLVLAASACAASSDDDGIEASAGAGTENLQASVKEHVVTSDAEGCKLQIKRPLVEVGDNAAATKAIGEALDGTIGPAQSAQKMCAERGTTSIEVEQFFTMVVNEHGVLSVRVSTSDPQPHVDSFTFDLKTGKRLALGDILSRTGIGIVKSRCDAGSESVEDPTSCANATATVKNLEVERDGLTIQLNAQNEIKVPWTAVDRNLLSSAIIDFLRQR